MSTHLIETIMSDKRPDQTELRTIRLAQLLPNPFRNLDRYPIRRDKVEALRESYRKTGFWGNVLGRPAKDDCVEQAYAHHRKVALVEEYGEDHEIQVLVRPLSDDLMIQIMARENQQEWETSATVEHETIRAVVQAYGEGLITLPKVSRDTSKNLIRYAPSFLMDGPSTVTDRAYTAKTLAEYIGWTLPSGEPQRKLSEALNALQYVEEGLLDDAVFNGLSTMQARAVVEEARRARLMRELDAKNFERIAEEEDKRAKEAEDVAERERAERAATHHRKKAKQSRKAGDKAASKVATGVAGKLRSGEIGYKGARKAADEIDDERPEPPVDKPPPHLRDFAETLRKDLGSILAHGTDPRTEKLLAVIQWRTELGEHDANELAGILTRLSERCLSYAAQLTEAKEPQDITRSPRRLGVVK